ncbi:hypothetical protein F4780DRAFT_747371 [Xylariomycetidae sp. FL0641]|nr:hypothetical protein F4780DRAFT_747371 [Xylariomycetidae sp. FL0641]
MMICSWLALCYLLALVVVLVVAAGSGEIHLIHTMGNPSIVPRAIRFHHNQGHLSILLLQVLKDKCDAGNRPWGGARPGTVIANPPPPHLSLPLFPTKRTNHRSSPVPPGGYISCQLLVSLVDETPP